MTSSAPDLETVVARLERVERQNRRMKYIGGVALLILGSLLLGAATARVSDEVRV